MSKTALLLIDVQKGFYDPIWGVRNNPSAEDKIALLLSVWRDKGFPVIHIQHCSIDENSPLRPEFSGNEFKDEARPLLGEKVFTKTVNSAFIGTELEEYLRENSIESLVITGLTTDHCVSTSTRMAGNLGFDVILVSDATATFDRTGADGSHYSAEQIHNTHLASLNGEFCTVLTSKEVLSTTASQSHQ
jgi:nicotinamidase-related amidase